MNRIAQGVVKMFCFRCGKMSVVNFAKRYNTVPGKIGTNIETEQSVGIRETNEGVSLVSVAEVGEMNGMKKCSGMESNEMKRNG